MSRDSRRGMELAISTLVVMILGIAIISGGIILVAKIFDKGIDTVTTISNQERQELVHRMNAGQLVATVPGDQELPAGKTGGVGIGIANILANGTFAISVQPSVDGPPVVVDNTDTTGTAWSILHLPTETIAQNQQQVFKVAITPGSKVAPGTYPFLVSVTHDGDPYGETRFFTIRVH